MIFPMFICLSMSLSWSVVLTNLILKNFGTCINSMVQKYGMQPPSNLGRLKFLGKDQVGRPSNVGVERVGGGGGR